MSGVVMAEIDIYFL